MTKKTMPREAHLPDRNIWLRQQESAIVTECRRAKNDILKRRILPFAIPYGIVGGFVGYNLVAMVQNPWIKTIAPLLLLGAFLYTTHNLYKKETAGIETRTRDDSEIDKAIVFSEILDKKYKENEIVLREVVCKNGKKIALNPLGYVHKVEKAAKPYEGYDKIENIQAALKMAEEFCFLVGAATNWNEDIMIEELEKHEYLRCVRPPVERNGHTSDEEIKLIQ